MTFRNAWAVAAKDFRIYRRKTNIIRTSIAFPVVVGVIFPVLLNYAIAGLNSAAIATRAPSLMNAYSIWFLICAATVPTAIASYSLVGEKLQKSLEPLLATPLTDDEILMGKTISGLLIPVGAIYAGTIIYMGLSDYITHSGLGYYYYPNWNIAVILFVVPFVCLLSVELNVIISSRMSDARSALQMGTYLLFPFVGLYIASDLGYFPFTDTNLLILAGVLLIVDVGLFFASKAIFHREEILTKWK
jgi:ABC-2 type transport system permease protein